MPPERWMVCVCMCVYVGEKKPTLHVFIHDIRLLGIWLPLCRGKRGKESSSEHYKKKARQVLSFVVIHFGRVHTSCWQQQQQPNASRCRAYVCVAEFEPGMMDTVWPSLVVFFWFVCLCINLYLGRTQRPAWNRVLHYHSISPGTSIAARWESYVLQELEPPNPLPIFC